MIVLISGEGIRGVIVLKRAFATSVSSCGNRLLQACDADDGEGGGEKHHHGGNQADKDELGNMSLDEGQAAEDRDSGRNEEHRHVFEQEIGYEFDAARVDDARNEQRQKEGHAHDVSGDGDGERGGYGVAHIANAQEECQLNGKMTCGFAKSLCVVPLSDVAGMLVWLC